MRNPSVITYSIRYIDDGVWRWQVSSVQRQVAFLDDCIAYLVTYIPGKMLRHYGPLSQQCLFEVGILMGELRNALQVHIYFYASSKQGLLINWALFYLVGMGYRKQRMC